MTVTPETETGVTKKLWLASDWLLAAYSIQSTVCESASL